MNEVTSATGLRLEIVENRRGAVPARRGCDFAFPGGTLGRGDDNDLVLPDAQQEIAHLQAIVYITHSGQHQLGNRGSLTLRLNGLPIERGQQRPLASGDTLEIGSFVLRASEAANARTEPQLKTAPTPASEAYIAMPLATALATPLTAPLNTPPAARAGPAADLEVPSEIWAMLAAEFVPATDRRPPPATDPQHPLLQEITREPSPTNPLLLREGALRAELPEADLSLLFAQDPLSAPEHIMTDTTPTVLAGQARREPITDDFLGTPLAFEPPPPPSEHTTAAAVASKGHGALADPLLDLLEGAVPLAPPPDEPRTGTAASAAPWPSFMDEAPPAPAAAAVAVAEAPFAAAESEPPSPPPEAERFPYSDPPALLPATLSQAFLEGMGLGTMQPAQLDRDHLYMAGRLLRLLSQGVIDLLAAGKEDLPARPRAGDAHNPFAVFPASEGVLVQLFAQPLPGFMPAETAVEQAFIDLRTLQRQGMRNGDARALVGEWLDRLHPQQLQWRFEAKPRSLLSINRMAALWRFYGEQHREVADEAGRRFEATPPRAAPRRTIPQELPWNGAL